MDLVSSSDEERKRTLYVRLPHRIQDRKQIEDLLDASVNYTIKLPRQASRACHVIFPTVEDKSKARTSIRLRNKASKEKKIQARHVREKPAGKKNDKRKIRVPGLHEKVEPSPKRMMVSNIKDGTLHKTLKAAFPGTMRIRMLGKRKNGVRSAFLKMKTVELVQAYVNQKQPWPVVEGHALQVTPATGGTSARKLRKLNKEYKAMTQAMTSQAKATSMEEEEVEDGESEDDSDESEEDEET